MYEKGLVTGHVMPQLARYLAENFSTCTRSKVGAVMFDTKSGLIASGYNETPSRPFCGEGGCPRGTRSYYEQGPGGDYSDCKAVHAEVLAIRRFQIFRKPGPFTRLYTSREPCKGCWEHITSVGMSEHQVHYQGK